MKQLLIKFRFWWRYRALKRRYRHLVQEHKLVVANFERQLAEQKSYWERRVEIEKGKTEAALLAGYDRLYEFAKVRGVRGVIEAKADEIEDELTPIDRLAELTPSQRDLLEDYKENFWQYEADEGRSDAEIDSLWKNQFEAEYIEMVKREL